MQYGNNVRCLLIKYKICMNCIYYIAVCNANKQIFNSVICYTIFIPK